MVNGPVFLVMVGPALAAFAIATLLRTPPIPPTGIAFGIGWVGAWVTWSILAPRWRLWAYERVAELDELKRLAVDERLIWPDGHIFGRTEIAPRWLRERLSQLDKQKGQAASTGSK